MLSLFQDDHCRVYEAKKEHCDVDILDDVSWLESKLIVWSQLRSNENTKHSIKKSYQQVRYKSWNDHESVQNHEEQISYDFASC